MQHPAGKGDGLPGHGVGLGRSQIDGQGIANPIGQIWSGAMMLDHLGHPEAVAAIEKVLKESDVKTPDMGGKANTKEMGQAVVEAL